MAEENTPASEAQASEAQTDKTGNGRKARKGRFALVSAYPLVHPRSKVRFTPNNGVEHEEDNWIKAQMEAGLIIKEK